MLRNIFTSVKSFCMKFCKFATFLAKRLNGSENIPKKIVWGTGLLYFFETSCSYLTCRQGKITKRCDVTSLKTDETPTSQVVIGVERRRHEVDWVGWTGKDIYPTVLDLVTPLIILSEKRLDRTF